MGSVLRRGDKWYLKWSDVAGRPQRRVTAARTKSAAQLLLAELELKVDRQKRGLEPLPVESDLTLAGFCGWWLENKCSKNSYDREKSRLELHVAGMPIGATPLKALSTQAIQAHMDVLKRERELGAASINKLRGTLLSVFQRGHKAGVWTGPNPIEGVERERVSKKRHRTLRANEVPLVLGQLSDDWLNFFAAAIWLALRKGELCGLKVSDIDWNEMVVWICRSYDYPNAKGGSAGDVLPVPAPLIPFLRDAVSRTTSEWVFPGTDGKMRTEDCDPQKILRTALARAGLVDGYFHVCRRCKAVDREGHTTRHADMNQRRCGFCEMRLWVSAIPRQMTFHDLRHTTGTLLIRAGVPATHVQKILRHASITTTIGTYGHLDVEDLRAELDAMAPLTEEQQRQLVAVNGPEISGPNGVQAMRQSDAGSPDMSEKLKMSGGFESGRSGGRTHDPRLVRATADVPPYTTGDPSLQQHSQGGPGVGSTCTPPKRTGPTHSGPPRVQRSTLRAVPPAEARLLGVREVARRLNVSTASVYKLLESGSLRHFRVLNAIRVSEADLADFLRGGGQ